MKIYSLLMVFITAMMFSCADDNLKPIITLDQLTIGGYPKLLAESATREYDMNNATGTSYNYTVEFITTDGGKNVTNYDVVVGLNSGTKVNVRSFTQADFTDSENGKRSITVSMPYTDVLAALGLTTAGVKPLDKFNFDGTMTLDDGNTYTFTNSSPTVNGNAFAGHFRFTLTATCPLNDASFTGTYKIAYLNVVTGGLGKPYDDTKTVTLTKVTTTRRRVVIPYLPFASATTTINMDLVCDKITIPSFNANKGCVDPVAFKQGAVTNFTFGSDATFDIEIVEFSTNKGCFQTPKTVQMRFTKQ